MIISEAGGPTRRRIIHVFGAMDRAGAELRTVEAVERLGRAEFDRTYVTLSGRAGNLAERIQASGDHVIPLPLDIRFPAAFIRLLRRSGADVVHSHVATFSGAILVLALLAGVRTRIAHFRSDGDQHVDSLRRRVQRTIMKALIGRSATAVIGVSPGALDHGWTPRWRADPRCRVVPNGIDIRAVPPVVDRWAVRHELGIRRDVPVICHVGRPAAVKNRSRAVDIACNPGLVGRAAVMLLVGPLADGERERWQTHTRTRGHGRAVQILGPRDDVLRLMNASDVTLVTSTNEGLPGVVLESLAVGTPVVGSGLPGVRWIAEELPGIEIRSLDDEDDLWARSIIDLFATASSDRRARLRSSFANGPFLLDAAAAEFGALWRVRTKKECS